MAFSVLGDELTEMYRSFVKVTLLLRGRVCKLAISVSASLRFSVVLVDVGFIFSYFLFAIIFGPGTVLLTVVVFSFIKVL